MSLIVNIKRGGMRKEVVVMRLEGVFGKENGQETERVEANEKIVERIEELSKREEPYDKWEKMRQDMKKKRREDKRLNVFWRKNKCFPTQFGGDEETQNLEETLRFWQIINNKEVAEGWREDTSIQEVLGNVRDELQNRRCRWCPFTEAEFDEVVRCTAPWKACGVDSVYSFPVQKCPPIRKAVFDLVKMVEWKVAD